MYYIVVISGAAADSAQNNIVQCYWEHSYKRSGSEACELVRLGNKDKHYIAPGPKRSKQSACRVSSISTLLREPVKHIRRSPGNGKMKDGASAIQDEKRIYSTCTVYIQRRISVQSRQRPEDRGVCC